MKIAILTLPLHTNYGGILQAYALQTVLERMGHSVNVLNTSVVKNIPAKWAWVFLKRIIKKKFLKKREIIFREHHEKKLYPILSQYTAPFIEKHIHQHIISKLDDVKESEYEVFIVGSDQVWNPYCFRPMWNTGMSDAFLAFVENKTCKKISYAASFGFEDWKISKKEIKECARLAKKFSALSVREKSGCILGKNHLDVNLEWVPDPTMILQREDYLKLIGNSFENGKNGLLNYILDESEEKQRLVVQIAEDFNLKPFRVNSKIENIFAPTEDRIQPPVEKWLAGFRDAKMVVTDSFHACIFSIIFNKPFVVYGNAGRGMARFESLLSFFDLTNNLIKSYKDYDKDNVNLKVDYSEKLNEFMNIGLSFLHSALK